MVERVENCGRGWEGVEGGGGSGKWWRMMDRVEDGGEDGGSGEYEKDEG